MELKEAILYSGNSNRLSQFLGSLMDFETHLRDEGIELVGKNIKFFVIDGVSVNREPGPSFEFEVKTKNDLEEIHKKVQFIEYSLLGSKKVVQNKNEIEETDQGHLLEVIDPDGRIWRFSSINEESA